jgi:hypothetical protein
MQLIRKQTEGQESGNGRSARWLKPSSTRICPEVYEAQSRLINQSLNPSLVLQHHAAGLALGLMFLAASAAASTDEPACRFLAEGDVYTESRLPFHGKHLETTVTHFELTFESGNWRVQTARNGRDARTGEDVCYRVLAGSTNSDIFAVSYFRENGSRDWKSQDWKCLGASTRTGPVPYVLLEPSLQMLWITFIAQYQYSSNGHQTLPATYFPYSPELFDATFSLPADVIHHVEPPHFILQLSVFLDRWRYWEGPQRIICAPLLERPLYPPYQSGCTNFTYCVTEFNHRDGFTWPSKFEFTFYGMKNYATNSADLVVMASAKGIVTKFSASPHADNTSFIPELPQGTMVAEGRFVTDKRPVSTFSYFSQGAWLSKTQLLKYPEYLTQVHIQEVLKPHASSGMNSSRVATKRRVQAVVCCMVLLPIIPLLVLFRNNNQVNNK